MPNNIVRGFQAETQWEDNSEQSLRAAFIIGRPIVSDRSAPARSQML